MFTTTEELYDIFLKNRMISTDSRTVTPGCLFFALKGDNFDGNRYAQGALESGAAYAVIDDPAFVGIGTLLVNDVLDVLQHLALLHRRNHHIPVVAITGSNGKTTTKELINAVLSRKYKVTATKGNLNNHIGVPLTLLGIDKDTELAIIEMGANHQGEIAQLSGIAEPTLGLITNIGRAHLGGFGGYEGVIKAKSELYTFLRETNGEAFVNAGNPLLMGLSEGMNRKLYGLPENSEIRGLVAESTEMLAVEWISGTNRIRINTNLVGNYNFENVMAAISIGKRFDVADSEIIAAIENYTPSNSRSQVMKTAVNSIILDAYNANPTSMQAAIENFRKVKAPQKMVILGDMLELGEESLVEHLSILKLIETCGFDKVILVGPDFSEVAGGKYFCFLKSEDAFHWLKDQQFRDYSILVKGSRGIKMEKVLEAL